MTDCPQMEASQIPYRTKWKQLAPFGSPLKGA